MLDRNRETLRGNYKGFLVNLKRGGDKSGKLNISFMGGIESAGRRSREKGCGGKRGTTWRTTIILIGGFLVWMAIELGPVGEFDLGKTEKGGRGRYIWFGRPLRLNSVIDN